MGVRDSLELPAGAHGTVYEWSRRRTKPRFHRHAELEFNLVTAGHATCLVEDRRYDLTAGSLLWLFPEENHLLIDESPDFFMWIPVFRPELVRRVCRRPESSELKRDRPTQPISSRPSPRASDEIAGLCRRLYERTEQIDYFNAGLTYLLQLAWDAHRRADAAEPNAGVDPMVERVARRLREHADAENVEDLAERIGVSSTRLSRLFLRQTGVTITAYRQRCALERFVQLFGDGTRRSTTQAAFEAGFGSYPQFHRVFKRAYGFGPAEYRRRMRSGREPAPD